MKDEELIVGRTNDKRDIMASLFEGNTGRITIAVVGRVYDERRCCGRRRGACPHYVSCFVI